MIYGTSTSTFPDDGYGVSTDNPESAAEIIENRLKIKDEMKMVEAIRELKEELASWFFNTEEWNDEWWEAWGDKFRELT